MAPVQMIGANSRDALGLGEWRLPNFLIIGAMKAGTTTLYRDLSCNPLIYFPVDKEPGNLSSEEVLSVGGLMAYSAMFRSATAAQICGDASTDYSKQPDITGVAKRAAQVLGHGVKIIYVVRDPVERAISHYNHLVVHKGLRTPLEEALHRMPEILNYSRYGSQLATWIQLFSRDQVLVIKFERYVRDRRGTISDVSRFLGVPPETRSIDEERVFNATEGATVASGIWNSVRESRLYRRAVRGRMSADTRERLREALLPKPRIHVSKLGSREKFRVREVLKADTERFARLVGWRYPVEEWS